MMARVKAGYEVFRNAAAAMKLFVLSHSENRMQLAGSQIGNANRLHVRLYQKWNYN